MDTEPQHDVTRLLSEWKKGNQAALDSLIPLVQSELRRLAANYLRNERPGHTLQPTALINEAWLQMAQQGQPDFQGRSHFVAIAAHYMRQVLVEHARSKNARKRGAGAQQVDLNDANFFAPERSSELVALDDGLNELAKFAPRQAKIVELSFFGGLTHDEVAAFLDINRRTVLRDLRMAEVWLKEYVSR